MGKGLAWESANTPQRIEINSFEQAEQFLTGLQSTASESIASALSAQLQVIKYIDAPELINSSFDLLFQNIKKSISYADLPSHKEQLREKGILMIQNYVFFMNAKLKFAVEDNKKEGTALLESALLQLGKTATDVALLATTKGAGGLSKANVIFSFKNQISNNAEEIPGFFKRVVNYFNKGAENAKKMAEFYKTLDSLISKLIKHREMIGQSDLIAGMINNYAEDLTNYAASGYYQEFLDTKASIEAENKESDSSLTQVAGCAVGLLFLAAVIILICNTFSGIASWFSDSASDGISFWGWMWKQGLVSIVIIALVGFQGSSTIEKNKELLKQKEQEYADAWWKIRNNYTAIADSFDE